jgi:hypothetical protein
MSLAEHRDVSSRIEKLFRKKEEILAVSPPRGFPFLKLG